MTDQEKLQKIVQLLAKYRDAEAVFMPPTEETERQRQFREDLHAIVTVLFKNADDLSVTELKSRVQTIWQETKPKGWQ